MPEEKIVEGIKRLSVALKEADETAYWLELLYESGVIDQLVFDSLYSDLSEIISKNIFKNP